MNVSGLCSVGSCTHFARMMGLCARHLANFKRYGHVGLESDRAVTVGWACLPCCVEWRAPKTDRTQRCWMCGALGRYRHALSPEESAQLPAPNCAASSDFAAVE